MTHEIFYPQVARLVIRYLFSESIYPARALINPKIGSQKSLFAMIFLWMVITGANAQRLPKILLSQYVSESWNAEAGLPQNTVLNFAQTHDGFLWLGTEEGLVRFDGFKFKIYDQSNTPELISNVISSLAADPSGGLWIGLRKGGLAYFNGDVFSRPVADKRLALETITSILVGENQGLFLGTESLGLFIVNGADVERLTGPFGKYEITTLATWPGKGLLVGSAGGGLLLYKDGVFREIALGEHPLARFISKVIHSPGKGLYVATQGAGLFLANELGARQIHDDQEVARNFVQTLSIGAQGDLWWGTDHGLGRMMDGITEYFYVRDPDRADAIDAMMHDRDGNLWLGIPGIGLRRYTQGVFTTTSSEEGLCNDVVWSLAETNDNKILVGTENGGYCVMAEGRVVSKKIVEPLNHGNVDCIAVDSQDQLWIGNIDGLFRVAGNEVEKIGKGHPIFEENIFPLHVDGKDQVWFGSGSHFYRLEGETTVPIKHDALDAGTINGLAECDEGNLWIGAGEGLFKIVDDEVTWFPPPSGRHGSKQIYGLLPEDDGIWVSHFNFGLGWFEKGRYKFLENAGLPEGVPYSIVEDDLGYLWYTSNRGIVRVAKSALREWLKSPGGTLKWRRFGISDGMKNPECNLGGNSPIIKDRHGNLWFSTVGGVTTVNPKSIHSQKAAPQPYFALVLVDGLPFEFEDAVHLPPEFDSLEIRFGAIEFDDPNSIQFHTRLHGKTLPLKASSGDLAAYFTQLPPGQMIFSASAGNAFRGYARSQLKLHVPARKTVLFRNRLFILLGIAGFFLLAFWVWKWIESCQQLQTTSASFSRLQETEKSKRALLNRTAHRLDHAHEAADKAVIQTQLLHNVGNILNSVSVSSGLMEKILRGNGLYGLIHKILALLKNHESNQTAFLTQSEQGQKIPAALSDIAEIMEEGKQELFNEMANLQLQCAHIQDVVKSLDQTGSRYEFCRLSLIIEDALKLQGYLIAKSGVQVSRDLDEDLYVSSQKAQLLQILVNLIKNAVESLAGSPKKEVLSLKIQTFQREDEAVVLEIIDNGMGINQEDLDRLFDKGFTTKKHGHGLGLSYCRNKMREMNGELIAKSLGEGKGATFSLIFSGTSS